MFNGESKFFSRYLAVTQLDMVRFVWAQEGVKNYKEMKFSFVVTNVLFLKLSFLVAKVYFVFSFMKFLLSLGVTWIQFFFFSVSCVFYFYLKEYERKFGIFTLLLFLFFWCYKEMNKRDVGANEKKNEIFGTDTFVLD